MVGDVCCGVSDKVERCDDSCLFTTSRVPCDVQVCKYRKLSNHKHSFFKINSLTFLCPWIINWMQGAKMLRSAKSDITWTLIEVTDRLKANVQSHSI